MKNTLLELWRYLFMMAIVVFHFCGNCKYALNEGDFFWFRTGFIYVEFFFILTGFLTAKHFYDKPSNTREGLDYAYRKFRRIAPEYIVVILVSFALRQYPSPWSQISWRTELQQLVANLTLLTSAYAPDGGRNVIVYPPQLWFLSAMLIALPAICILLGSRYKELFSRYFAALVFILYYGRTGFRERGVWPSDIMRGLAGMCLGVFLFELSTALCKRMEAVPRPISKFLRVMACILMGTTLYLTYKGYWDSLNLVVMMFATGIILLDSTNDCVVRRKWMNFIDYLGRLSFYIFLVHFVVIIFLNRTLLIYHSGREKGLLLYLSITLLVSAVFCHVSQLTRKRRNHENKGNTDKGIRTGDKPAR